MLYTYACVTLNIYEDVHLECDFFQDFITLKRLFINMYIFDILTFLTELSIIFIIHLMIYFMNFL